MPDQEHDRRHPPGQGAASHRPHHSERLPVDPDLAPDDPGEPSARHRPVRHVHRARQSSMLAAIGVGGFIGAWGRYELVLAWEPSPAHVPWATLGINTSGAFLLGLVLTLLLRRGRRAAYLRPFFCTGVLGAWTTMSTFAVESDLLVKDGHLGVAGAYLSATVLAGLLLTWAGARAARVLVERGTVPWASR